MNPPDSRGSQQRRIGTLRAASLLVLTSSERLSQALHGDASEDHATYVASAAASLNTNVEGLRAARRTRCHASARRRAASVLDDRRHNAHDGLRRVGVSAASAAPAARRGARRAHGATRARRHAGSDTTAKSRQGRLMQRTVLDKSVHAPVMKSSRRGGFFLSTCRPLHAAITATHLPEIRIAGQSVQDYTRACNRSSKNNAGRTPGLRKKGMGLLRMTVISASASSHARPRRNDD
jgi:hypothetical protein